MTSQELALLGYYIFPCKGKTPMVKWSAESTIDAETIRQWSIKYPECNWGLDCGKSGLIVLDDDRGKKPVARMNLEALEIEYGALPPTFIVETPSGGRHYYYYGSGKNSASSKLGEGLDTRGVGGYVIAPGSTGYKILHSAPVSDAPDWLIDLIGRPNEFPALPAVEVKTDEEAAIERSIAFLKSAPPAIEGQGGDDLTFRIACRVKDFGVSMDTCLNLMEDYWNPRCLPPWDITDLRRKVYNAYNYGSAAPGVSTPEAAFSTFIDTAPSSVFVEANVLLTRQIKIEYLIHRLIETPSTGLIFGDPSSGKSFLAVDMALSVACGTSWMGSMARQGVAVYFAGEGRHGIQRRIAAWKKHYGLEIPVNYLWVSERRVEFSEKSLARVADELKVIEDKAGLPISIMFVDTLARHMPSAADENSARDMGSFINACDWLRDKFRAVAAVVHHSGKMNKSNSRGSSAIRGAMDWEFQVNNKKDIRDITFTKQKESEIPSPMGFYLKQIDLGNDIHSAVPLFCAYDPTGGRGNKLTPNTALYLQIVKMEISTAGGKSALSSLVDEAYRDQSGGKGSASSMAIKRAKETLLKEQLIRFEGDKIFLTEDSTESYEEDEF